MGCRQSSSVSYQTGIKRDNDEVREAALQAVGDEATQSPDLVTRIELKLAGSKLRRTSNCRVKVYLKSGLEKYQLIGRTEILPDTQNPTFAQGIFLDFLFEVQQKVRFEVYHVPQSTGKSRESDFLGLAEMHLAEIVTSPGGVVTRELEHSTRPSGNGFATAELPIESLCRGDPARKILFQMMDQKGPDKLIGSGSCSLADLQAASIKEAPVVVQLLRPDDKAAEAGALTLENIGEFSEADPHQLVKHVSFLEYIEGGLEINLIVAIDFTFSNGDPNHPSSLHYYDPHSANDYVMAIRAVGEILEHYDQDKKYPVYGFGAKLPPDYSHTSHLFACNGDYFLPEVVGVDGIVDAYRKGPSRWAEQYSVGKTDEQKYFILLILTDGAIVDLQATIDAINVLDADDHPLVSSIDHSTMERDIVSPHPSSNREATFKCFEAPKCIEQDKRRTVRVLTKCGLSATGAAGLVEDSLPCIDDEYLAALAKQRPREDNPAAGGPFYQ
ncbi:hypothetical protein FOZ60_001909, partial [Perkinsus olseni]